MRIAVIGVGHWHAPMHLDAVARAAARLVGVCDDVADVADTVARDRGVPAWATVDALLDGAAPDLVVAMGKPDRVLEIAALLVERAVPCIVEKPIGTSGASLDSLTAEVRRRGAFVAVPLVNRYSALWTRLAELRTAGRVGRPVHAHFRVINGSPERYRRLGVPWMLDPRVSGGGSLRNLGIHAIDAFAQLVGDEEVRLEGAVLQAPADDPDADTFAALRLATASGTIGTVETGYTLATMRGSDTEWRVAVEGAYLVDRNQSLRVATLDDGSDETTSIPSVAARYDEFLADTVHRVLERRPPAVSLIDFHRADLLIDEAYRTGRRVSREERP
jgi:predicted dehydrogenase